MRSTQPAPVVRVVVADGSVIHTELLAQAIAKDRHIRVVELSSSSKEVLKAVVEAEPDVLLISENLDQRPGGGLELLCQIRETHPGVKPVVLLDSSDRESVIQAFRAGSRGVFCRNQPVKLLCKCIAAVNTGQVWANSSELGFLLEALAAAPALHSGDAETLSILSDRERDVVRCLAEGLSNREIASRLGISQHTVKNYMFRVFEKLGVSSRLELLFFVLTRTGHAQDVVNQLTRNRAELTPKPPTGKDLQQIKIRAIRTGVGSDRKDADSLTKPPQLAASGR